MNSVLINLCFSSALICPLLFCSKKIKRYLILVRNCWASSKLFLNGKGLLICSDASTDFSDTSWLPPIIFGRIRMHTNCSRALWLRHRSCRVVCHTTVDVSVLLSGCLNRQASIYSICQRNLLNLFYFLFEGCHGGQLHTWQPKLSMPRAL